MIRPAETDADLAAWCEVWNAITPREPIRVDEVKRRIARQPERLYLVADDAGAGCVAPTDSAGRLYVGVRVLPEERRRGLGSALFEPLVAHARDLEPEWLSTMVSEAEPESIAWAERRGFAEYGRQVELVLALRGDEQAPAPLDGIEVVELTDELLGAAYELTREALVDLPTEVTIDTPSYEVWLEEEVPGPVAFVALDDGDVVGFAALMERGAGRLEHGLTATRRSHRRRGIATMLKRTEIAWAAEKGYRELITFTQDRNEGMQAINLTLGFAPQPAWISMRRRP
ncbi:MAG TPA: GNAT family N-acetyltransferase [Gaiellaceae bacterium]|nr:GNAT family N-acetyltransferase [Gaiellaceae bacterium]